MNAGSMDFKEQFDDITRTILSNQTEALKNLTDKVWLTFINDVTRQKLCSRTAILSSLYTSGFASCGKRWDKFYAL